MTQLGFDFVEVNTLVATQKKPERLVISNHESPVQRAIHCILWGTQYLELNDWQKSVMWTHLRYREDAALKMTDEGRMFELAYIMGFLECESIMTRTMMCKIAREEGCVIPE